MNKLLTGIWILLFFIGNESILLGQVNISGDLYNENHSCIEGANVLLLTKDSLLFKGVTTNKEGKFFFRNVGEGDYCLKISCIGYKSTWIKVEPVVSDIILDRIILERDTFLLQAANVEGPRIFYKNDRLLIFPSKKELQYSTNGVNLLMNIGLPRIWVDPVHNAVKMNGGRVQLCINGQKAGDKEVLSLLPKEISRIEYSDNLNLRYKDADVVINYVTKKCFPEV